MADHINQQQAFMQKTFFLLLVSLTASCHSESYSIQGCPRLTPADVETFNQKVAMIKKKVNNELTIEHRIVDGCETRSVQRSGKAP